jgi:murein L,D-transpeptidase YcbB/YkuD
VRVQNPFEFADAILPHAAPEWNAERLRKLFGPNERRINLDNPVPVHIAYFTLWIDPDTKMRHFADIYAYDAGMSEFQGY